MPHTPPASLSDVMALVSSLADHGVDCGKTVAHGATLADSLYSPDPPPTLRLLDLSVAEIADHCYDLAVRRAVGDTLQNVRSQVVAEALKQELVIELRGQADAILDTLRPTFDAAADGLRNAIAAGITTSTTAEHVLDSNTGDRALYRAIPGHLHTLNGIASIRAMMSLVLLLPPQRDALDEGRVDYSPAFTRTDATGTFLYGGTGHIEWHRHAPTLHLASVAETVSNLRARRGDVALDVTYATR